MTITYSLDVSSSTFLSIHRLLLRWKGSIWKSIWPELSGWLIGYYALSLSYRFLMNKEQQMVFEDICVFFHRYADYIPITFMLGFYVSAVFTRWSEIFMNLGWIDSPAILLSTIVRGTTEEARMIRRNIVRYLVLVQAMVYRDISAAVKKRFPTMDHLVTAGIMTAAELKEYDSIETEHIKYWSPIQWAFLLLRRARDQGLIDSDIIYVDMLEKIRQYRVNVLTLTLYDWVPIPLVYTQVVNLAVRLYFLIALFARQFLFDFGGRNMHEKSSIDLVVPVMTLLQFLFYMGWVKVAEVMLNPFGEDDDDFETNWIIDRNLQCGLMIVDDCYGRVPLLEKDQFWAQSNPTLLYTKEAANRAQNPMMGSCNDVHQQEDMLLLQPRHRRLMSTVAGQPVNLVDGREGGGHSPEDLVVPVPNHNPSRRISVVQNAYSEGQFGVRKASKFLDTVRRKLSRAPGAVLARRRESNESSKCSDRLERGHSTRVSINSVASTGSLSGSVQNFLWGGGGKTTAAIAKPNGDIRTSTREVQTAQQQQRVHFETEQKQQQQPQQTQQRELLPVIEEEASEARTAEGNEGVKCPSSSSTSDTSLESVASSKRATSSPDRDHNPDMKPDPDGAGGGEGKK